MTDYVIIEVTPGEDDYSTIPHHQIFAREDFSEIGITEHARPISYILRNGDEWEFFSGDKDIEDDIPSGITSSFSNDEFQDVSHVARLFLDPKANYYTPRVILQQI
jgi:hypothetical protein